MKFVYVSILLFSLFSGLIKPIVPLLEFLINKEDIILYLCEQRDAEVNECQGQCHLTKQTQANATNPHQPATLINFDDVPTCFVVSTETGKSLSYADTDFGKNPSCVIDKSVPHRLLRPPIA